MNDPADHASPRPCHLTAINRVLILDVTLMTLVWCLSAVVVNPIGDFPLLDDWAYGATVKDFLETGDYRPWQWAIMSLISNVLWGSLFCLPGEFSFTALRVSTLVAGLVGLIGSYVLVRDLQQPRWLALLVTFTLALNPVFYALSHTFMTDVLFTTLAVWSAVFLLRYLNSGAQYHIVIGALFALAATLSRQLAIGIPAAFAVVSLLRERITLRNTATALTPLFLCVSAFVLLQQWLTSKGMPIRTLTIFDAFRYINGHHVLFTISQLFGHLYIVLINLGLFLLPILLLSAKDFFMSYGRRSAISFGLGALVVAVVAVLRSQYGDGDRPNGDGILLPIYDNVLVKYGVGPVMVRDSFILGLDSLRALPVPFWVIVTALSFVGAALLLARLSLFAHDVTSRFIRGKAASHIEVGAIFLLFSAIIYLLPLFISITLFDRYMVVLIPLVGAGVASMLSPLEGRSFANAKPERSIAYVVVAMFGLFAISGTHDYLAWNRVRWAALLDLVHRDHIDVRDIDGGFEFNGLYLFQQVNIGSRGSPKSWWWVERDTYQIGFGPVAGYTTVAEYPYQRWLLPCIEKVVVLRKTE